LSEKVNDALEDGWVISGPPFVFNDLICQLMIKPDQIPAVRTAWEKYQALVKLGK